MKVNNTMNRRYRESAHYSKYTLKTKPTVYGNTASQIDKKFPNFVTTQMSSGKPDLFDHISFAVFLCNITLASNNFQ